MDLSSADMTLLPEAIGEALCDGWPLGRVEAELIEPTDLTEGDKAALWLFAWSSPSRDGAPRARMFE